MLLGPAARAAGGHAKGRRAKHVTRAGVGPPRAMRNAARHRKARTSSYRATELPSYRATELSSNRASEQPSHRSKHQLRAGAVLKSSILTVLYPPIALK